MSALGDELAETIRLEGPITLERYMALALGHPGHGYYMTRDPFGAAGDFVTSPEISQMFGELLGVWVAEVWAAMGAPKRLRLVELGPGRGTLMADALRAARVSAPFLAALDVHLVETSPVLRRAQERALAESGVPLCWHERFEDVPPGPAVVLANEFFDALPVRQFVRGESGWHERLVGLGADGHLAFGLAGAPEPGLAVLAEPGAVVEIGAQAHRLVHTIAAKLVADGGALLAIDYGHVETGLGETLQAVRTHAHVDPLADPGEADLTTHVDFSSLSRAARAAGAAVVGPVEQGRFLEAIGIVERAQALARTADAEQAEALEAAFERLMGTEPSQMGSLFKVLGVTAPGLVVPGFADGPA